MKKLLIILILFFSSCGYSFNLKTGTPLNLHGIKVKSPLFPGLEAELDNRLLLDFQKRGVIFNNNCPELFISLISPSGKNYLFTKEGKVSQTIGIVVYSVKIINCNGKIIKRTYKIPFNFSYYGNPKDTIASEKSHIIESIEGLTDNIINEIK